MAKLAAKKSGNPRDNLHSLIIRNKDWKQKNDSQQMAKKMEQHKR